MFILIHRALFSQRPPVPLSHILSVSSFPRLPKCWGGGFNEDITPRDECSTLCMVFGCGFLYSFQSAAGWSFSDDGCTRYWSMRIAECHGKAFYQYAFCCCFHFFKASIIWFYPMFLGCLVSDFCSPKECQVWVPLCGVSLKSNHLVVGYSQQLCATIALSCGYYSIVDQRVCAWDGVYTSPLGTCRVSSCNKD